MQGTQAPSLVQEDPTCCRATKPVLHNYWARRPESLRSAAREAHSPQRKSSPRSLQLEKAHVQQQRPSAAKKMTTVFKKINMLKKKRKRNVSTLKKKKLSTNKSPEPDGYTGEFCQTFREELTLIFLKLLQRKEVSQTHSVRPTITLIPKPDKHTTHTHRQAKITNDRHRNPQQNSSSRNPTIH